MVDANIDETKGALKPVLGQGMWKWTLAAGLLSMVLGGIVLAWPGPSIR